MASAMDTEIAEAQRWHDLSRGRFIRPDEDFTVTGARARARGERARAKALRSGSAPARHSPGYATSSSSKRPRSPRKRQPSQLHNLLGLARPLLSESEDKSGQQAAEQSIQALLKSNSNAVAAANQGLPLLHCAAQGGCCDLVHLLLGMRAEINGLDADGGSALHLAAHEGEVETCTALILARADVNLHDANGQTPLFSADVAEVCRVLTESRADICASDKMNKSALHVAGCAGRPEVLATLSSQAGSSALEQRDDSGGTPWDYIQQSGSVRPAPPPEVEEEKKPLRGLYALVQPLIKRSGGLAEQHRALQLIRKLLTTVPGSATTWSGPGTPLRTAVVAGRADLAHLLLDAHADPKEYDDEGRTLLHYAAKTKGMAGHYVVKELVASAADINARDNRGEPPLFNVRTCQMCETVLECKAELHALNFLGQSVLHITAREGAADVFRMLLARVDSLFIDVEDLNGDSAFEYAELSGMGGRDANMQLLEAPVTDDGAKRGRKLGKRSRSTPMMIGGRALEATSGEGLKMLLKTNGRQTPRLKRETAQFEKDFDSLTADDLYEVVKPLLTPASTPEEQVIAFRSAQHLLKRVQVPSTWHGPGTPLSTAVMAGRKKLVRLLLRSAANPNEKDAKGAPMLHHAAFDGSSDMCQALLSARAEVDLRDSQGQTALFFAADCTVCRLLLDSRADCAARDLRGASPLHNVARAGLEDVFKLMYSQSDDITHQLLDQQGNTIFDYAASAGILASAIPTFADHDRSKNQRFLRDSVTYTSAEGLDVAQIMQKSYQRKHTFSEQDGLPFDENGMLVGSKVETEVHLAEVRNLGPPGEQLASGNRKQHKKRIRALRCLSAERSEATRRAKSEDRAQSAEPRPAAANQRSRSPEETSSDAQSSLRMRRQSKTKAQSPIKKLKSSLTAFKKVNVLRHLQTKKEDLGGNFVYEMTRPIWNADSTEDMRRTALVSLRNHLSRLDRPPDTWSGPDTPLHGAVQAKSLEVVNLLLMANATANIADTHGKTSLHTACAGGDSHICEALMNARGDVNAKDHVGNTPLFFADTLNICQLLVKCNAKVTSMNDYTETAMDIAARSGREDIYMWLSDEIKRPPEEPASPSLSISDGSTLNAQLETVNKSSGKQPPMSRVLEAHDLLLRELAAHPESPQQSEPAKPLQKEWTQSEYPAYLRQVQAAQRQGFPVLLTSETDESALRHAIKLCAEQEPTEPETVCMTLHSHTTISELYGHFEITNRQVEFVAGVLTRAVMQGHWLILSGLNHAPSAVLESIQDMLVQVFDEKNHNDRTFKMSGLISHCEAVLRNRTTPGGSIKKLRAAVRRSTLLTMAFANKEEEQVMPMLHYKCHANFRFFGTSLKSEFVLPMSVWSHFVTIDLSDEARNRPHIPKNLGTNWARGTLRLRASEDPRQVPLEAYNTLNEFCDRCCKLNRSGLIAGDDGSGKTTSWHAWASTRLPEEKEIIVVRLHANTSSADLMGAFVSSAEDQVRHPFRWRDGPVARAIKEGYAVLLCGLHLPCPSALHCLTGVLDAGLYRRVLINRISVPVHEDFCIFATAKNEESVHPSLRSYFEHFQFTGVMGVPDVKRLGFGILGAQFGPEHVLEKLADSYTTSGVKKWPIGALARAMHRARLLSALHATPVDKRDAAKADFAVEALKIAKALGNSEKTGVLDIHNLQWLSHLRLKSANESRKYDGREDIGQILTALHAARMPAILEGPPGEGKRTSARRFVQCYDAHYHDFQPLTVTLTKSMAPEEMFGQVHRTPGHVEYIRGPFEIALTEGRILIVDRINEGSPAVLAHLADAVSFPPKVFNPITAEYINVHPNFWFIGIQSLDQTHQRYVLPDALHHRAVVIPLGEKTLAKLRQLLEESDCFPEGLKRDAKLTVLDELMNSAQKANSSNQVDHYDFRSCLKICRRICGNPSADMSTASPEMASKAALTEHSAPRKTLVSMAKDLDTFRKKGLMSSDKELRIEQRNHIKRLVQLHIRVFFAHYHAIQYRVKRTTNAETAEPTWNFTVEEQCDSPVNISVSFPASYDKSVDEELSTLGDAQRALLCQLAFALRYRENVLLVGPSSFKAYTTSLLTRMLRFEHFSDGAPPLNKPILSRMSEIEDLFGGVEPHTFQTFAKYCQHAVAPLHFKAHKGLTPRNPVREQLEELKQLTTHLTTSLRKLYLQPGTGTKDGILIAEGHKRMVTKLHQRLSSCGAQEHMFTICERGIMQTIRFGGICLMSHVEELRAAVMETLAPLLDMDSKSFRHPLVLEPTRSDKIPVHPQCYFVCTATSLESLTLELQRSFTCLVVPRPSPDDISCVFRRSLNAAAKIKNLNETTFNALLERLTPLAKSFDSMRKVVWLASMAGVLQVDHNVEVIASLVEYLLSDQIPRERAGMHVIGKSAPKPQLPASVRWNRLTCCKDLSTDFWSKVVDCPKSRMMAWHLIAAAECQAHGLPHPTTVFVSAPGSGKTFLCREVAKFLGKEFVSIACNVNTGVEELFGTYAAVTHQSGKVAFQFKEGALIQAVQRHAVVLFDDLNMLQPHVMSAVLAFLRSDPEEGLCTMRDFTCDQRECLFCGTMNPEDLGQGRLPLVPLATHLLRFVNVDYTEEDIRRIMQTVWDKNMKLEMAWQCGKALNLNLRAMLRFMQMLPDEEWQLGDRPEVDATALALRLSLPTEGTARAIASENLQLVLSSTEHTKPIADALSRHLPLAVTPSDVLHAAWPNWAGLSKPGPDTTFKYPGFILVSGPFCSGKRTVVRKAAAWVPNMQLLEICVTHETCAADLIGGVVPVFSTSTQLGQKTNHGNIHFQFVQGPLLWAAKRGYWCLIANIDQARPEVLERLNSLGECPPSLTLVEQLSTGVSIQDVQVKVHPNFRLFFTVSTHRSESGFRLSRPFLDRCVNVSFDDGIKEWCNAADKISEQFDNKAELAKRVVANHRALMQRNGPAMHANWTPDTGVPLPTLRGLCRALKASAKQSDVRLHDWVMKSAYGNVIPRDFNRGLLVPSRTGENLDEGDDGHPQKQKGLFGRLMEDEEEQPEDVPQTRGQQLWAKLKKEAAPQAEVAGSWNRLKEAAPKKDQSNIFSKLAKQMKDWQGKVEEFDKHPLRAGLTVAQLRSFAVTHCGKYGAKLRMLCTEHNNTNSAAISRGAKKELAPNMHAVAELCIKPSTLDKECSLAQMFNPDGLDVDFYVSHSWNQDFQEYVSSIKDFMTEFCKHMNASRRLHKNPNDYSLWICAMSINLHCFQRSLPSEEETMETALFARLLHNRLQGVLFLLDKNCNTLTRSWCLCELYFAHKFGLPVDTWISSSANDLSSAISSLSVDTSETSEKADKSMIAEELAWFTHGEYRRGHDGFNNWAKQMLWDMALRFYMAKGSEEGRLLAEKNLADTQAPGVTGHYIVEPMEVKDINNRLKYCRPLIESLARTLMRKRQPTVPVKVVIDSAFLGLSLHPNGARCVGDLIVVILCTMASIRVEFEVISAGDESSPPRLLKAIDDHLPVVWRSLIRGVVGRGHFLSRTLPVHRSEQANMLAISAEGRGLQLKLDDIGISLHESGIRRLGGINIMCRPGAPAEMSIVDVQRSFKQHRPHVFHGPDALSILLQAIVLKEGGKARQSAVPVYQFSPVFHTDDPFLRERHEHPLSELEALPPPLQASCMGTGARFIAERIDEEFMGNEGPHSRSKKQTSEIDLRSLSTARLYSKRRKSVDMDPQAHKPVSKRAREIMEKLYNHSTKLQYPFRPGAAQATESLWDQLRSAFDVYVHHSERALLRVSEAENRQHEAKPSVGTDFSLKKIVKWFLMDGAESDMWEARQNFEIAGSMVLVMDCSAMQCCDIARFAAATVFTCEHIGIPFGVVRWDQRGVQLVKPAPAKNKPNVLKELTSAWDTPSKSCFLRALADSQAAPRLRASMAQMSDAVLAAANVLIEGDYPAPRRVILVPQAFEPVDHGALLDAWHYCEEFARAECISVNLCPASAPLPRTVSMDNVTPSVFAHVLGSIFSQDTPFAEPEVEEPIMPSWSPLSNERISILSTLNVMKRPVAYSMNLEYRARSEEEAKQYHQVLRQLSVPFREFDIESATALPSRTASEIGWQENDVASEDEFASEAAASVAASVTSYGSASSFGRRQRALAPGVLDALRSMEAEEEKKAAAQQNEIDFRTSDKQMMTMVLQIQRKLKSAAYDRGGVNWLKIFREYDKDRSGEIDFEEFLAAIRRSAKITKNVMSDQDLRAIFDFVDMDSNSLIDYETEFVPWMQADFSEKKETKRPLPSPEVVFTIKAKLMKAASEKGGLNWSKVFKLFDSDGSGFLDRPEFKMTIRRGAKVNDMMVSDQELDLIFNYIDADGSGKVNYEDEFLAFLQPPEAMDEDDETSGPAGNDPADATFTSSNSLPNAGAKASDREGSMPSDEMVREIKRKLKAAAYIQGVVHWEKLFKDYDKDNNRELDFEEFKPVIRKCAKIPVKVLSDKDLWALFNQIDSDHDREIKISEFAKWIEGEHVEMSAAVMTPTTTDGESSRDHAGPDKDKVPLRHHHSSQPSDTQIMHVKRKLKAAAYNQGGVDWYKLFRECDKDKSGFLDIDEFKTAIRKCCKLNAKVLPDRDIHSLYNFIDKDGDKTVHVTEFTNWMQENPVKESASPFQRLIGGIKSKILYCVSDSHLDWPVLFHEYDTEKVGRIKYADLRALMRRGAKVTPAQVNDEDLKILYDYINLTDDPRGIVYESGFFPWLCKDERTVKKQRSRPASADDLAQRDRKLLKELASGPLLNQIQRKLKSAAYTAGGVDWEKLFRDVDRDNSGLLDFDEFHACVRKHAKITKNVLSDKDLRALFDYVDKDGSQEVDYKLEFLPWAQEKLMDSRPATPTPVLSPEEIAARAQLEEKADMIKMRLRSAAEDQGGVDWAQAFTSGKEGLNSANFEEFKTAIRKKAKISSQVITDGELRKVFEYHDFQNDGRLDLQAVMVPWLQPPMELMALQQERASMVGEFHSLSATSNGSRRQSTTKRRK